MVPSLPARLLTGLVLAAVPAFHSYRATQAPRVLDKPQVELPDPFTNVTSVRELSDGRVIVIDNGDRALYAVDFTAGASTQISRPGSGPAEYRTPGLLLPWAGDTTLLTDAGNSRLLVLGPDAQPVAVITDAWPLPNGGRGTRLPRGIDAKGRGYFQSAINFGPPPTTGGEIKSPDSLALVRAARGSTADESLGYVHLAPRRISTTAKDGQLSAVEIRIPPFPAQDGWQAFADGAVAIARSPNYRVDWVLPDGRRVAGPTIAYAPVRVTELDRKPPEIAGRTARGGTQGGAPPNKPPEMDWPEFKPPFPSAGVLAGTDGRLWVPRHAAAADVRTHYDIIDRRGVVAGRAEVPNGGRIVGFGPRSIYVVRKDADDLQYLQRFPLK
jgi:hypothetical protein